MNKKMGGMIRGMGLWWPVAVIWLILGIAGWENIYARGSDVWDGLV